MGPGLCGQYVLVEAAVHTAATLGVAGSAILTRIVSSPPSFEDVFRAEYAGVVRIVRAMGVRSFEAEDVAQAVFMVVNRRFGSYDASRPIRAWLFGITRRVVKDHVRASRRAAARERDRHPIQAAPLDPEAQTERGEAVSLVEKILGSMKDEWRLPFILTEIEGHTAPEVATMLGWKLPTVYTRLRRARAHFEAERIKLQEEEVVRG